MSDKLLYDDQLKKRLEEISLPAGDTAWEDMKRRLDEDSDDKPFISPLPKGCGWYCLLLLPVLLAALFIINPVKQFHHETKNPDTSKGLVSVNGVSQPISSNAAPVKAPEPEEERPLKKNSIQHQDTTSKQEQTNNKPLLAANITVNNKPPRKQKHPGFHTGEKQHVAINAARGDSFDSRREEINSKTDTLTKQGDITVNTSKVKAKEKQHENFTDTANREKVIDSLKKKDSASAKLKKEDGKHHYSFSAGFALDQLIPINGQKSNPYNNLGRKSFWGDYIPSIYLRIYRDQKWFFQSEFRYGAPQYTKDVIYIPKKIIDTSGTTTTYSRSRLKKTFYNEIPLSVHYFILPKFSAGAGVTINTFKSALVQRDVHLANTVNQSDSLVATSLVSQTKADSNFAKTYVQALIEAQYQWRRFSIGARYSFGLQPYLTFTLPGGERRKEKNSAVQLLIGFEIWNDKKK